MRAMRQLAVVALIAGLVACGGDGPSIDAGAQRFGIGPNPGNGGGFIPPGPAPSSGGGSGGGLASLPITACNLGSAMSGLGSSGSGTCEAVVNAIVAGNGVLVTVSGGSATVTDAVNNYAGKHLEWNDEFLFSQSLTNASTNGIWGVNCSGTSAAISGSVIGTTTRPGILDFATGTSGTGRCAFSTSNQAIDFNSGSWDMQWTGGFATLAVPTQAYNVEIGFDDTQSAIDAVDGCYFLYDHNNVAAGGQNSGSADDLECVCAANSVRKIYLMAGAGNSDESFPLGTAPVAALTLPSTNIYTLEVKMTGTTRAEFFYNGTKMCDIATDIPSGAARLTGATMQILNGNGALSRTMDVDRTHVAVDLNGARSP